MSGERELRDQADGRVACCGSPEPARQARAPGYGRLEPHGGFLVAAIETQPDITMPELSAALLQAHGVAADPAVLSRFLCRRGFTYKVALMAAGRARADVPADRDTWMKRRQLLRKHCFDNTPACLAPR